MQLFLQCLHVMLFSSPVQLTGLRRPTFYTENICISGVPRGGGVQTPPLNLPKKNVYSVFAKYTLLSLLLCSLNPKFYTGKR